MITEPTEATGQFWLPGQPDDSTAGTLLTNPDGSAELKLVDIVSGDWEHHMSRVTVQVGTFVPPTRIVGEITGAKKVTLENCFASPMKLHYVQHQQEPTNYRVGHVLRGAEWEKDEKVKFNTLILSIEGLDEWIGKSGFTFEDFLNRSGYSVKFARLPDIKLGSWNGTDVSIGYSWRGPNIGPQVFEISASQEAHFRLDTTSPVSFERLFETARRLRDFVSLGVGRNLLFTSLTGFLNGLGQDDGDGGFYRRPIEIFIRDTRKRDRETVPFYTEMLFQFDATQKKSGSRFVDWLKSYDKHYLPIDEYYGVFDLSSIGWAQRYRTMFRVVETLFEQTSNEKKMPTAEFNRIVAKIISSFADEPDAGKHVTDAFNNRLSARERLERVFGANLGIRSDAPVVRAASRSIVRTRDALTHVAGADTAEFYVTHHARIKVEVLDAVIRIWMLRLAGFDLEDALSIAKQNTWLWRHVEGIIKSKDKSLNEMSDEVWWKRRLKS